MTFAEYTAARRSKKLGGTVDDDAIGKFADTQPKRCPKCGVMVLDPFNMRVVIHDVDGCPVPIISLGRE